MLGIRIARDITLADVQKKLGNVQLVESGDAGEYKATICYFLPKCQTQVDFWSDELGGPGHDLIGFTLSRKNISSAVCSELAIGECSSLKVPRGVRLGMTLEEFKMAVDTDIKLEGSFYQKVFERREPMTEAEQTRMLKEHPDISRDDLYWDIVIFVRGAFRSGALDILEVSKTMTN